MYSVKDADAPQGWRRPEWTPMAAIPETDLNEVNFENEVNQRCYGRPQCSGSRLDIGPRIAMSLHLRVRTGLEWHRAKERYSIKESGAPQGWRKPVWTPMAPIQEAMTGAHGEVIKTSEGLMSYKIRTVH